MLYQIIRKGDEFIINEIIKELANKVALNQEISKYNFIISDTNERWQEVIGIVQKVPYIGKNEKLKKLVNDLYKKFSEKYPQYVKTFSIPFSISNEPYALAVTDSFIKVVSAGKSKSYRGRVHISQTLSYQFLRECGNQVLKEDCPQLYNKWKEEADQIYKGQLRNYLKIIQK